MTDSSDCVRTADSPSKLIPASPEENLIFQIHEEFDGDAIASVVARVRGCIEEGPLRIALSRLQLRHPKLRSRIVSKEGRHFYDVLVEPPTIPIEIKEFETADLPWQAEMNRGIHMKLDFSTGRIARAIVLRNRSLQFCDFILVMTHAVADGASTFAVLDDVFSFYEEAEKGGYLPPVISLPLVIGSRAAVSGSWMQRLSLLARMAWKWRGGTNARWLVLPRSQQTPEVPLVIRHVFDEKETSAIARRCREEQTTMLGALYAAAVFALADLVPDPKPRIRTRVPIDVRRSVINAAGPVSSHDLGCFISGYKRPLTIDRQQPFWELARKILAELITFAAAGGPEILFNMVRFARTSMFKRKSRRDTLAVNLVARTGFRPRYGSLSVEACSTLPKGDHLGPSLFVMGIVVNGRFCVNVLAARESGEFWQRFHEALARRLHEIAAQPST